MRVGIQVRSLYTGMGCAEMSIVAILWGLQRLFNFEPPSDGGFVFESATDRDPTCRMVLRSWVGTHAPRKIFSDLLDRLPADVQCDDD